MMSFNLFIAVAYVAITIIYAFYYYKKYHSFLESEINIKDDNREPDRYTKFEIQFAKGYTIKKIKYTDIIISSVLIGISILSVVFTFIPIRMSDFILFLVLFFFIVTIGICTLYFISGADYLKSRVILALGLSVSLCVCVGVWRYCIKNAYFDEFNIPFILIIYTSMLFNLMITKFNDLYREKMYTKGLYEGWKLESESESQEE